MLENQLMNEYEKTVARANDVIFYDGLITQNLGKNEDVGAVKEYTQNMLNAVRQWQKSLSQYQKIALKLKRDVDEIGAAISDDGGDGHLEKGGKELLRRKKSSS